MQSNCAVAYSSNSPLTVPSSSNTTAGNLLIITTGRDVTFDAGVVRTTPNLPLSLVRTTATAEQVIETYWAPSPGGPLTVDMDLGAPGVGGGAVLFVHEYEGIGEPLRWVEASGLDTLVAPHISAGPGELVFATMKSTGSAGDPNPPFTPRNRCGSDLSADVIAVDGGDFAFATTTNNALWLAQVHVFGRPDAGLDGGVSDSGVSDSGVADAGVSDAGVADAGVADAGVSDAGARRGTRGRCGRTERCGTSRASRRGGSWAASPLSRRVQQRPCVGLACSTRVVGCGSPRSSGNLRSQVATLMKQQREERGVQGRQGCAARALPKE